ncbi:MAG TPA: phage holin family protein [Terriglobia bacterium]|nr:phage holin family protein [Terriglobia bacterium]
MKQRIYTDDPPSNGRPFADIFRDIVSHIAEIVRAEIRLATLELKDDVAALKMAAIAIAVGGILAGYGVVFILLSLVAALAVVWPPWLAALAVGLGVAVIGGIVIKVGINRLKLPRKKGSLQNSGGQNVAGTGRNKSSH